MWIELSEAVGEALWGLRKGRTHKYIRRVPKPGGGYRYYYRTSGVTRAVGADLKPGAKFKLSHEGEAGHFEVVGRSGDRVTLRHDESGGTMQVSAKELSDLLHREHADVVQAQRARTKRNLEAARKHGTAKQIARLEAEAERFGVEAEKPEPMSPSSKMAQAARRTGDDRLAKIIEKGKPLRRSSAAWAKLAKDPYELTNAAELMVTGEGAHVLDAKPGILALVGRPGLARLIHKHRNPSRIAIQMAVLNNPHVKTILEQPRLTNKLHIPSWGIDGQTKQQTKRALRLLQDAGWVRDLGDGDYSVDIGTWAGGNDANEAVALIAAFDRPEHQSEVQRGSLKSHPLVKMVLETAQMKADALDRLWRLAYDNASKIGAKPGYIAGAERLTLPN